MKHIHMIAICGVGMAPMAVLLKESGFRVTGSDKAAYPPMSNVLADAGIEVIQGFAAANVADKPDVVIVGNAVPRVNPEAEEVERLGLKKMSLPEAIAHFFLSGRRSLVVAGTHGKTTTTGMLARALQGAGLDPGYLVGGLVEDLGRMVYRGGGEFFAIEGDEYDSAYFDKGPKFLHYQPSAAIVTSLEFDHADIYTDLDHVKSSFRKLAGIIPAGAPLVCCGDARDLMSTVTGAGQGCLVTYGTGENCKFRITGVYADADGSRAAILYNDKPEDELRLGTFGEMNLLNGLAVYALLRELGVDVTGAKEALAEFRGAARRQQLLTQGRISIVDDFAHHPTAIAETIKSMRARFPGRKLRVVFEPRSNTSRRAVFQRRFADALGGADAVVLSEVFAKENDPLRPEEMLSTAKLVEDLEIAGVNAWVADGPDAIYQRLVGEIGDGDVVVCMSNGGFGGLPHRLAAAFGGLV